MRRIGCALHTQEWMWPGIGAYYQSPPAKRRGDPFSVICLSRLSVCGLCLSVLR